MKITDYDGYVYCFECGGVNYRLVVGIYSHTATLTKVITDGYVEFVSHKRFEDVPPVYEESNAVECNREFAAWLKDVGFNV